MLCVCEDGASHVGRTVDGYGGVSARLGAPSNESTLSAARRQFYTSSSVTDASMDTVCTHTHIRPSALRRFGIHIGRQGEQDRRWLRTAIQNSPRTVQRVPVLGRVGGRLGAAVCAARRRCRCPACDGGYIIARKIVAHE